MEPREYATLISPRVVALITTMDNLGKANAAPFSFVGPLSFDPPLVYFAIGPGKRTLKNVLETKEFVMNIVSESFGQKAVNCALRADEYVDKMKKSGLETKRSKHVKPPSIKGSPVILECQVTEFIEPKESDHVVVVGKVVHAECAKTKDGHPDIKDILMHIGKDSYTVAGKEITLKRPG